MWCAQRGWRLQRVLDTVRYIHLYVGCDNCCWFLLFIVGVEIGIGNINKSGHLLFRKFYLFFVYKGWAEDSCVGLLSYFCIETLDLYVIQIPQRAVYYCYRKAEGFLRQIINYCNMV